MSLVREVFPNLHIYEDREVGIEIEMEGRNLIEQCPGWVCVRDGSLRGESMEYVLKAPVVRKDVEKLLSRLHKAFEFNHAEINPSDRCGVHVHINCQAMSVTKVYNFAILYFIFEDLLVKYCGEDREGNLFCLRAKDAEGLLYAMNLCAANGELHNLQADKYRYASLNFSSLRKYGTLEFRSLRTPKVVTTIRDWVVLLLALKDAALAFNKPTEIVERLSFNGPDAFIEEVFGKHAQLLPNKDRAKSVFEGVRRIQDIAYSYKENSQKIAGVNVPELNIPDDDIPLVPPGNPGPFPPRPGAIPNLEVAVPPVNIAMEKERMKWLIANLQNAEIKKPRIRPIKKMENF